jgi:hypothetical protein
MIQSHLGKVLVWGNIHDGLEDPAKMKRAYQAVLCQLLQ